MYSYELYKSLRDREGLTNYRVSEKAGIHGASLYAWGKGKCEPKYQTMKKVASVFGLTPEFFMEDE